MVKVQVDIELAGSDFENPQALGHNFFANTVSGYGGDAFLGHGGLLLGSSCKWNILNAQTGFAHL